MSIVRDPETKAQADTFEAFDEWTPFSDGWDHSSHRDGENLVRTARQIECDEDGQKVYDREAHGWAYTGLVRERVIAPDGSAVSEREHQEA